MQSDVILNFLQALQCIFHSPEMQQTSLFTGQEKQTIKKQYCVEQHKNEKK